MCCIESKGGRIGLCIVVVIVLGTSATLFGVSWSSLEPNEVGINFNGNTRTINEEKVYTAGRHFLGLGHSFIKYPKSLQEVATNINVRTIDGLAVTCQVFFNYRIKTDVNELIPLYLDFGGHADAETAYLRITENWVRVVAARYEAFAFFINRTQIQLEMQTTVNQQIEMEHGVIETFQLQGIVFPARFQTARIAQETALQEVEQAENERIVARINAQTRVDSAVLESNLQVINAQATATAISLDNQVAIDGLRARYEAEKENYALVAQNLGLSTSQLLTLLWVSSMEQGQSSGAVIRLDRPSLFDSIGDASLMG